MDGKVAAGEEFSLLGGGGITDEGQEVPLNFVDPIGNGVFARASMAAKISKISLSGILRKSFFVDLRQVIL